MYNNIKRQRKQSVKKIKVGTYFDTLSPELKIKYKENNKPKNCKCSGVDLVFGNGTYWYCGNCKEVK